MRLYLEHRNVRRPIESYKLSDLKSVSDRIIAVFSSKHNPEAYRVDIQLDGRTKMFFVALFENHSKQSFAFAIGDRMVRSLFDTFCNEAVARINDYHASGKHR